jgi:hypothetical protein
MNFALLRVERRSLLRRATFITGNGQSSSRQQFSLQQPQQQQQQQQRRSVATLTAHRRSKIFDTKPALLTSFYATKPPTTSGDSKSRMVHAKDVTNDGAGPANAEVANQLVLQALEKANSGQFEEGKKALELAVDHYRRLGDKVGLIRAMNTSAIFCDNFSIFCRATLRSHYFLSNFAMLVFLD